MRFLPAGPNALLVELGDLDDVFSLLAEIHRRRQDGWEPGLVDIVPGATTILLDGTSDPGRLAADLAGWTVPRLPPDPSRTVDIPCRYSGPDLAEVARAWAVTEPEVAEIHTSLHHRVAFCGFAPGFAYIAGLDARRPVPRRATPRPTVAAGSVAVAGVYSGVYPRSSPGGWQLIGHTDTVLWDLDREPAALLSPGTAVRFVDVAA